MLPLATTTITVEARTDTAEPYEAPTWAPTASGVPAHISDPSGQEQSIGGSEELIDAVLLTEHATVVRHVNRILDENTGQHYELVWVQTREGLGLDHLKAGLRRTQGLAG